MSDTPKKTLDQITQDVLNSQFGITDADLSLLFEDKSTDKTQVPTPTTITPSEETVMEPVVEPAVTPVTPAPPAPIIPSVTPPEPNRQAEPVPDKSKDVESSLNAQKEQIAQMQMLLQELIKRSQATETAIKPVTTPNPLDEIDDQTIIEKPKETIVKLVQGILKVVLPAAFSEYDVQISKRAAMDEFRRNHKDFDELRPIMRQIVQENPTVNDDVSALPRVYQEAKDRKAAMLTSMRKELNIPEVPVTPVPPVQPAISEEDMLAKLEQRIVEKIRKRRAALAATSLTTNPVAPVTRMTPIAKEAPKTEADIMFDAMMKAGVPSTGFLRDVDTVKK